ncbi:hypothetical protein DFH08DRAFT_716471 [Mycena albidolilacea]|uniref:MULE transposase domain-containing protein n=1 Tax=Mycena albidolilacea TaxID=1033008 RepID=A0AAD7EDF3_9AGAR|nr:hypothetical protein DFH08DRAFT_716471 [Mycena albidolilacea]
MITFDCKGWLFITTSNFAFVRLQHELDHVPYHRKEVPTKVKEYVVVNPRLTAPQVNSSKFIWLWFLSLFEYRDTVKIPFSCRGVYHLWAKLNREKWKRHEDELVSARIIIDKATKDSCSGDTKTGRPPLYRVKPVSLPEIDGFRALAFVLPDVLWKSTNKSKYEVFAIIGEQSGSGCPLGYLLIKADPKSEKGGKQKYLEAILGHLCDEWEIYAATTLSDKDWSEINACLKKFSEGKHQLCSWHVLCAVKQRLAVRKR